MAPPDDDQVVRQFRERISELDRGIFDAINKRLGLVAELKRHKDEHGLSFLDPDRERRMFDYQSGRNPGPLSDDGLRAFYTELLALTKREVG